MKRLLLLLLIAPFLLGYTCPSRDVVEGQRIFHSCKMVINSECVAGTEFKPFGEQSIDVSCEDCHQQPHNYGGSVVGFRALPVDHPLFTSGQEDPKLLHDFGLVSCGPDCFRMVPSLIHLRDTCDKTGHCENPMGLLGNLTHDLCKFARGAVELHMKGTEPTDKQCDQLIAFMLDKGFAATRTEPSVDVLHDHGGKKYSR